MPVTSRRSSSTGRRDRRRRAHEHRRGASPEKLALDLAVAAIEALPAGRRAVAAGRAARRRRSSRCSAAGGPRATRSCSRGGRAGSRRSWSAACPAATRRIFEPEGEDRFRSVEGRERGELLRVVRDDRRRGREALLRDVSAAPRAVDLLAVRPVAGDVERDRDADVDGDQDRRPSAGSTGRRRAGPR